MVKKKDVMMTLRFVKFAEPTLKEISMHENKPNKYERKLKAKQNKRRKK